MPDTPTLPALPPLRDVIAAHGLSPRKSLGQNFLLDLNITRRIAGTAGPLDGKTVLEIGPGPGGLTRALLDAGARRVVAVERDTRCIHALRELAATVGDRLQIVELDAMEFDLKPLAATSGKIAIVANLPYNIATALLIGWLKQIEFINRMVLMFQSEVADRLIATPGSKTYGRISIAAQWRCEVKQAFTLSARAFTPPPKVDSTVVEFVPRPAPVAEADSDALEKVVAAAFSQRRKMLRAGLKSLFDDPGATLEAVGVAPTARAETVDIAGFCALARAYAREMA